MSVDESVPTDIHESLRSRVHAHTRLSDSWRKNAGYDAAGQVLFDMGARVVTRHFKSRDENPIWPTTFASSQADLAKDLVEQSDQLGLSYIAYYWIMSDEAVEDIHPEWVCKNRAGSRISGKRGVFLDITSGYKDIVLQRLLELAGRGILGFYFDSTHLPRRGCLGTDLERRFIAEEKDVLKRNYMEHFRRYQASEIAKVFRYWKTEVVAEYPDVVFVISTGSLPTLLNQALTTEIAEISDFPKTEHRTALNEGANLRVFQKYPDLPAPRDDVRMGLGWALLRDSADGRAPHVWSPSFDSIEEAHAFVWSVITFGGIANLNIEERLILGKNASSRRLDYAPLFELGEAIAPLFASTNVVKWGGLYFSEYARDNSGGHDDAWRKVLWPVNAAFQCFVDHGLPVKIFNDRQITPEQLKGVRLLVTPNRSLLPDDNVAALIDFAENGGEWMEVPQKAFEGDKSAIEMSTAKLCAVIDERRDTAPISIKSSASRMHATFFEDEDGGYLVGISHDFTGVIARDGKTPRRNNKSEEAERLQIILNGRSVRHVSDALNRKRLPFACADGYCTVDVPNFAYGTLIRVRY